MRDFPNASLNYSLRAQTPYFRARLIHLLTNQQKRLVELRFRRFRLPAIASPLFHDYPDGERCGERPHGGPSPNPRAPRLEGDDLLLKFSVRGLAANLLHHAGGKAGRGLAAR
jgi:hypothetical protein